MQRSRGVSSRDPRGTRTCASLGLLAAVTPRARRNTHRLTRTAAADLRGPLLDHLDGVSVEPFALLGGEICCSSAKAFPWVPISSC